LSNLATLLVYSAEISIHVDIGVLLLLYRKLENSFQEGKIQLQVNTIEKEFLQLFTQKGNQTS